MNKSLWIGIVIVVIIVGVWFMSRGTPSTTPSTAASSTVPATSPATTQAAASSTATAVLISNMAFTPTSITVKVGATVTWTNNDSVAHTVVGTGSNIPTSFGSKDLSAGQTYSFTFSTPGTYTYHCSIHPQMTGTVVVQ